MYNDIYVRDGLGDTGLYPFIGDVLWASPDVIPYAQKFLSAQQAIATFLTDSGYGQDQAIALSYGTMNYVYLRGRNLGSNISSGTAHLFWTMGSLLLMPNQWIQNELAVYGGGSATLVGSDGAATVAAGGRCVVQAPFLFAPSPPSDNTHYCLIAVVVTPGHPNVYPPTPGPSGQLPLEVFCEWVRDNPPVAWRNLAVNLDRALPTQIWAQTFSNPQPQSGPFFFMVDCTDIPVGSTVALQCPEAGPSPAINVTLTVVQPNDTLYFGTTLPAQFGPASLIVTLNLPAGQKLQPDSQIVVSYATGENEGGPLTRFSARPEQHGWSRAGLSPHGLKANMQIVYLGNFVMVWR